jgi:hypothetical protein
MYLVRLPFIKSLAHLLVWVQNFITINLTKLGVSKLPKNKIKLKRLGSDYGGWWVPVSDSIKISDKLLISAGLGFDVTFDKLMLEDHYFVIGLDPLAGPYKYATKELSEFKNKILLNKGISTFTGKQKFFSPINPEHDSWSISNSQNTNINLMQMYDVIAPQDLPLNFKEDSFVILKMDIEGGEEDLLTYICNTRFRVDYLAVELDCLSLISFLSFKKRIRKIIFVRRVLASLSESGFRLIKTENFNFFWLHENSISKIGQ